MYKKENNMNTHFTQGKSFVEGFFDKLKKIATAKPSERLNILTGGEKNTGVVGKVARHAKKVVVNG